MGFKDEIRDSKNEIFEELGDDEPVEWAGKEYRCIVSEGQSSLDLEVGGFVPQGNFTLKFKESDLDSTYPSVGQIIKYGGEYFRIEWVSSRRKCGQFEVSVKPKDK